MGRPPDGLHACLAPSGPLRGSDEVDTAGLTRPPFGEVGRSSRASTSEAMAAVPFIVMTVLWVAIAIIGSFVVSRIRGIDHS